MTILNKGLMSAIRETHKFCGECAKFHKPECEWGIDEETGHHFMNAKSRACIQFEPRVRGDKGDRGVKTRRGKISEEWQIDLTKEIQPTLKPCGFYGDQLNEAVWLPFTNILGQTKLRPAIITHKKDQELQVIDFYETTIGFKGTFPSKDMDSLMSVNAYKMLKSNTRVNQYNVDKEIDNAFIKHLDMPEAERILCKRWIEATYFYDTFDALPIQCILGVSESGKSRLCLLNLALCYHSEGLIDPTEATIFRSKEEDRVTLIIDEAEYLRDPRLFKTIKILLNASYSKHSGYVSRYDEVNGKRVKMRFDLYSPMCISGIAGLEGITLSRAFRIVMRRVDKDFPKATPNMYRQLRDKLYVLRIRNCFDIQKLYDKTDISSFVSARFEELFKPLFTMTKFFAIDDMDDTDDKEYEIMKKWCQEYQKNFRAEALNVSDEEQILLVIYELQAEAKKDYTLDPFWTGIKQLADRVSLKYTRNIKSRTASNILYRLGFTSRKKIHGYMHAFTPPKLVEDATRRLGIPSPSLNDTPISPQSPNTQEEKDEKWLQKELEKQNKKEK